MGQRISLIIGALLIVAAITGTVFAWGGCGQGGRSGRDHNDRMAVMTKELNLTPDQEIQLKSTKETHRAQMGNLRLALKEKRQALKGELSKPGVTRQTVEPIVAEIKKLEADITGQRVDGIFKIKEILTPGQFAKLQAKKGAKCKEGKMKNCRKGW